MSAIRNDDECHRKQKFYIPHITHSMDTFTVGRGLLSLNYVMDGIEKYCLRHKYSFPIALTARRNCKKSATFSITLVICGLEKFCCMQHSSSFFAKRSQPDEKKKNNKNKATNISIYMELFS